MYFHLEVEGHSLPYILKEKGLIASTTKTDADGWRHTAIFPF